MKAPCKYAVFVIDFLNQYFIFLFFECNNQGANKYFQYKYIIQLDQAFKAFIPK